MGSWIFWNLLWSLKWRGFGVLYTISQLESRVGPVFSSVCLLSYGRNVLEFNPVGVWFVFWKVGVQKSDLCLMSLKDDLRWWQRRWFQGWLWETISQTEISNFMGQDMNMNLYYSRSKQQSPPKRMGGCKQPPAPRNLRAIEMTPLKPPQKCWFSFWNPWNNRHVPGNRLVGEC